MRVLIILKYIPSAVHDQKSDLLGSSIKAHQIEGHEVVLLTSGRSEQHGWKEIKTSWNLLQKVRTALSLKYKKSFSGSGLSFYVASEAARFHKRYPVDMIFAECTTYYPALHAYEISRALGVPFVIREHKIYERKIKVIDDLREDYLRALRAADAVVAVSPLLASLMKDIGVRDDIGHIPNALSDEFFSPPADYGQYRDWAGSDFIFAGWTRWRDFKRVDLLLKAFSKVLRNGCRARLVIAGPLEPAENERWVYDYIKEQGLAEQVLLTGGVSRAEIHRLAHSCHCCVVPSDYETFGLPALEALAAGKPVVTTRCNGPEYVVDSEQLGRVVERGSVEELFKGMLEVYADYEAFDRVMISRSAYERFSRSKVAGQFTALYEDILNKR